MIGVPVTEPSHTTLRDLTHQALTIGEPSVSGALAVYPIFGGPPRFEYVGFEDALRAGMSLKELPGGAAVRRLVVENPIALPVLLFEGEEVRGAQQNRVFDVSALIPAHSTLEVPVSCVERGRWDGTRHAEPLARAPQAAFPAMRETRYRLRAMREQESTVQRAVWEAVDGKLADHAAPTATSAMDDVFSHVGAAIDDRANAIAPRDGQLGALVAIGGRFVVLDYVSRPAVFGSLHGPLVRGYALDALDNAGADAPSLEAAEEFLADALDGTVHQEDRLGLGEQIQCVGTSTGGTGVAWGGELIAASVFSEQRPGPGGPGQAQSARFVRPPSRRRNR